GYAITSIGLLVVLSPLGSIVNGAHSWIALPGGFQAEPSEFAKVTLILMVALIPQRAARRGPAPAAPGPGGGTGLRGAPARPGRSPARSGCADPDGGGAGR